MHSGMWDLEQAWEQRWCPLVNGVLFPDGGLLPVGPWPAGAGAPIVGVRAPLTALPRAAPVRWTTIEPLARAVSPDRAFIAAAGDGGLPSAGFVALMAGPLGGLVWLAFFDQGGPFEGVRFDGGCVVARARGGREVCLPADAPDRLQVTAAAPR
jgi:hypothetical protein